MDLREAAGTLGVHYQTAYDWVRQGVLPARKVGRGYEIDDSDVGMLAAGRRLGQEPARPIHVRDWAAQSQGLYAVVVAGEETQARHRLERLAVGVPLIDLCEHVIAPALRQLGADWEAGRVSIAQEHRASAICERLIAVHARQPAGRPRGTAVVATPPGERHSLPSLMAAACCARTAGSFITWRPTCRSRRSPGSPARSVPTWSCCHPPGARRPGRHSRPRRRSLPPAHG